MVQFLNCPRTAPPPNVEAELLTSKQLFRLSRGTRYAPPPDWAELRMKLQLLKVPSIAPPPQKYAELPTRTQFEIRQADASQKIPPPFWVVLGSPLVVSVAPLVSVNPLKAAPLVIYTQRIAVGPLWCLGPDNPV